MAKQSVIVILIWSERYLEQKRTFQVLWGMECLGYKSLVRSCQVVGNMASIAHSCNEQRCCFEDPSHCDSDRRPSMS